MQLCSDKNLHLIDWIYKINTKSLKDQGFINEALRFMQWNVVEFFIKIFPKIILLLLNFLLKKP